MDLRATCASNLQRPGHLLLLILALALPGCGSARASFTEDLFEQFSFTTGSPQHQTRHQTVVPAALLGGRNVELAVVSTDEENNHQLRIYTSNESTWKLAVDVELSPGVLFIDIANIEGRDRLLLYRRERLCWLDLDSETERELPAVTTRYNATDQQGVPRVDITRDLNQDGRDDLVLPDLDGFWITTQQPDGTFTEFTKLGPPEPFLDQSSFEDKRTYREIGINALTMPWYQSRVHEMDFNRDGRSDLVFFNQDHFEVHYQEASGQFSPLARAFQTDVPFDSDGTYSLAAEFSNKSTFALLTGLRRKSKRTVVHSFRDMNGDQVADLVTQSLKGRSILRQRSLYEVHQGSATGNGIEFAVEASTRIRPRGKAGGLQLSGYSSHDFRDLDGDGHIDLMQRDVKIGVAKMIRAIVGHSVALDLEFYRIEEGKHQKRPTTKRKIRPEIRIFKTRGNVFLPPVLLGDINGDGRDDLLAGESPEVLHVFLGEPGPDLLASEPKKVAVELPYDERNTTLVDLNQDGKQDVLIHLTPTHGNPDQPHRITTLIAR